MFCTTQTPATKRSTAWKARLRIKNEPPDRTHSMNAFAGVFTSDGTVADESGESFCTSTDCLLAGIFQQKNALVVHFWFLLWEREGERQTS
jgi:hypothetical protein